MPKPIIICLLTLIHLSSFAQVSDIISVKKRNGRSIKSFYEGTHILFQTKDKDYIEGPIARIYHDTIYVKMYTVEKSFSSFGTYVFDTLNSYLIQTDYKDIRRISVYHRGSNREKLGALMMIGGAGYVALNVVNGTFFNLPITDKKNLRTLGISTAVFGAGFLNNKLFAANPYSRKHDQIVYISLN